MGADLYILKMDKEKQITGFEVSRRAVDVGYFRDCYNDYGLFPFINTNADMKEQFSWWQFSDNKSWFTETEDERNMNVAGAKKFLRLVEKAQRNILKKKELYRESTDHDKLHQLGKGLPIDKALAPEMFEKAKVRTKLTDKEKKEMLEWLELLVSFLRLAVKKNSPIGWSV
jgi:hypothetical protein